MGSSVVRSSRRSKPVTVEVEELVCARETRQINAEELGVNSPVELEASIVQQATVAHSAENESSTAQSTSIDQSAATNDIFPPTTSEFPSASDSVDRVVEDNVACFT
ncbi:hypothetical protein V6N13_059055 [Hibiscus sabdariffa]|uniref:Uncharacterized protein n=1 Tax=Hibiscus sabdariffa TaxID=183260 RepID=A0ABR2GEP9_9ROSI